ncbi:YlcI/YnfO family protein [Sinorhizobium medicae]|nr:YlcI/YnfO family protein [Sinorhizobium medicae]
MREAIDEARLDDESRAAFIRTAVENELARRLRKKAG